jgi:hypothetical protein
VGGAKLELQLSIEILTDEHVEHQDDCEEEIDHHHGLESRFWVL